GAKCGERRAGSVLPPSRCNDRSTAWQFWPAQAALGTTASPVFNHPQSSRSARMSDFPKFVQINEEGPREGFQFEKGPISTERKVALIDALSETGLNHIQVASFVNPNRVPGWAD